MQNIERNNIILINKSYQLFSFLIRNVYTFALVLFMFSFLSLSGVKAQSTCISLAQGVPGTILWQQPPNWWDFALGAPRFNTDLDAPSWRGALALTYGSGAIEQASFRALYHIEAGKKYLYLSWQSKAIVSLGNDNVLFVGFHDNTTSGKDVAIRIALPHSPAATTATEILPDSMIVFFKGSGVTTWSYYPGSGYTKSLPGWLTATARQWVTTGGTRTWSINIRIPITNADGGGISYFLDGGVNLSDEFLMWYELRSGRIVGGGGPSYTPYIWPRTVSSITDVTPVAPDFDPPQFPPTSDWGEFSIGGTSSCSEDGVTIRPIDIGTNNTPSNDIRVGVANTFFARPRNKALSVANGIKARFRIANWGSQATWEHDDLGFPLPDLWQDIGSVSGDPPGGINITAATNPLDREGSAGEGNINVAWTPPTTEYNVCGTPIDPDKKSCHQCILVSMTGSGVTFLNNSAYKNMDIVPASLFRREAEINVKGISTNPLGTLKRDVYLHVVTSNMPEIINQEMPKYDKNILTSAFSEVHEIQDSLKTDKDLTYEELSNLLPIYQIHAYYDSGLRRLENGINKAILLPMSSFGYFVTHDGELGGWRYGLRGAEEIIPNYYRIAVPNDSFVTVLTEIEALEPKLYAISFHLGIQLPHSSISNIYNSGFAGTLDFAYRLQRSFFVEALLGLYQFKGKSQISDIDVTQLAVNIKYIYPIRNRFNLFINTGGGVYKIDSGSNKYGYNFGVGLQYILSRSFALEAGYNFHDIIDTSTKFRFSTIQAIIRFRF